MSTPIADLHCHYPMHLPEAASEPDRSVRGIPFAEMRSFHRDPPLPRRLRMRAAWADRLRDSDGDRQPRGVQHGHHLPL